MKYRLEALLKKLHEAYLESDNKNNEYCKTNNRKWGYELIQSALVENQPLVMGFNWGVDNKWDRYVLGKEYRNQNRIKKMNFVKIYKGSIERSMTLLRQYFNNIEFENGSHANFCFFRSENESQITQKDISLCIPIFMELLEIVKPSVIFCFSSKARNFLVQNELIDNYKSKYLSNNTKNSFTSGKGSIRKTPIYFLPHPNYMLNGELRKKAWIFCSKIK